MSRARKSIIIGVMLLGLMFSGSTYAAKDTPVQLAAETIEYDANQKFVQAKGNVKMTQEGSVLSGPYAEYRGDTGIAVINGGITLTDDTIRLTGEQVEYDTNSGLGFVSGQPRMEDQDGAWMTGNKIEYNAREDQAVVIGSVHVVHPGRQIDATADRATYFDKERKVVLSGNARAIQEGNTLSGETLTIYMENKALDVKGNTKLIIIPNEKE
jgi:lipopolysaccharide export system protein LptA